MLYVLVESRDFSQAGKGRTVCKAEQIKKMTEFGQLCKQFFLSQFEKNHVTQLATAKIRGHVEHLNRIKLQ